MRLAGSIRETGHIWALSWWTMLLPGRHWAVKSQTWLYLLKSWPEKRSQTLGPIVKHSEARPSLARPPASDSRPWALPQISFRFSYRHINVMPWHSSCTS